MKKNYMDIAKNIIQVEIEELQKIKENLSYELIEIANEIYNCSGKVIITGIGKSGLIGKKIAATLSSTGTTSVFMNSTEALHGDLGMVTADDIVIGISNSGEGSELNSIIPAIKNIGARIFSITGNSNSTLARISDKFILCHIEREGCPLNLAPMASTTAELVIGDALAGILMHMRNFKPHNFAKYHPGGSLGRKLLTSVKNLTIPLEQLAICEVNTNIKEIILLLNNKRQGVVCVMNNTELIGIITEGDIRRALNDTDTFFYLRASDVMTKKYKKISHNVLASEALEKMEEGEFQISVMPVFDNEKFIGIVRIHDLIKIK